MLEEPDFALQQAPAVLQQEQLENNRAQAAVRRREMIFMGWILWWAVGL